MTAAPPPPLRTTRVIAQSQPRKVLAAAQSRCRPGDAPNRPRPPRTARACCFALMASGAELRDSAGAVSWRRPTPDRDLPGSTAVTLSRP